MPRTLDDVIDALPESERAKIEARAGELVAEEMSLRELRKAIGKTQTAVAKRLKVGQDAVSKIETRGDMYVSTLRDFIKAMGGDLQLVAQFPDRPPVRLEAVGTTILRRTRHHRRLTREEAKQELKVLEFNDDDENPALELLKLCMQAVRIVFHGGRAPARQEVLNLADALCQLEIVPPPMPFECEHARGKIIAALTTSDNYPPTVDEGERLHTYTKTELVKRFDRLIQARAARASANLSRD